MVRFAAETTAFMTIETVVVLKLNTPIGSELHCRINILPAAAPALQAVPSPKSVDVSAVSVELLLVVDILNRSSFQSTVSAQPESKAGETGAAAVFDK
jgi:hypothetical protein